jgi:hypothetical protein
MAVWIATPTVLYDVDRGRWMFFDYGRWRLATPQESAELPPPDLGRQAADRVFRFAWIADHGLGWTLLDSDGFRVEPWL